MPEPLSRFDLMGATQETFGRLTPDMRDLLRELLLHKSIFVGESFVELATRDHEEEDRTFRRVFDETVAQGVDTSRRLEEWDRLPHDVEKLETLAKDVRRNLIEALIVLKELSTEAFLASAMAAPTKTLRDEIIRLADIDRKHADVLRGTIGATTVGEKLRKKQAEDPGGPCGAHAGRYLTGTLSRSVETTIQRFIERGVQPARLVVGPTTLRHLRDEGAVDGNTAFGLPIEVDMGWTGETFAFVTRERVSLAEILTAEATQAERTE